MFHRSVGSLSFLLLCHTGNSVPNHYVQNGKGFLSRHLGKKHYASDNRDMVCFLHESLRALFRFLRLPRKYPTGSMDGYNVGNTNASRPLKYTICQYTDQASD